MRAFVIALLIVAVAGTCLALPPTLSPSPAVKIVTPRVVPPPDVATLRQGGDTIDDAFVIASLPFTDSGTTVGYTDNYAEDCPYGSTSSPDVVYAYTPVSDTALDIDLCGSNFDTMLYLFDADLNLVDCNDDYYGGAPCGAYVSRIVGATVQAGVQYFIVIDGFFQDAGDYQLAVTDLADCDLVCPAGGVLEGEPPLQDGQPNDFNGGCSSNSPNAFQTITGDENGELVLCGRGGWFYFMDMDLRDTDWFVATMGEGGSITVTADAELPLYVFRLEPLDCISVAPTTSMTVGPCAPQTMTFTDTPGALIWLWTGATAYEPPGGVTPFEFDYTLWISGLAAGPVAIEPTTWSTIKTIYR